MTREEAIQKIKDDLRLHHDYLSGDYRKALRMAIEALQQPEQRWIPCSEKLPKKSGQYYVSGESKVWICEFLTIHSSTKLLGGWCNDAANPVVQAWMPLPEPYKPDPCNGCGYLGESCVGEGCGKLTERKDGEA